MERKTWNRNRKMRRKSPRQDKIISPLTRVQLTGRNWKRNRESTVRNLKSPVTCRKCSITANRIWWKCPQSSETKPLNWTSACLLEKTRTAVSAHHHMVRQVPDGAAAGWLQGRQYHQTREREPWLVALKILVVLHAQLNNVRYNTSSIQTLPIIV